MAPSARPGPSAPSRWVLCLAVGVAAGVVVGFAVGLARPRSWPDPVAPG
ncbi:MAG: hypothetical protein ACRYG2_25810 [Janthinobacterium lividum]